MTGFFTQVFDIDPQTLDDYGAFDISLVNDLPLFIDPFLLFNSEKEEYRALHDNIIKYMIFLKDKANSSFVNDDLLSLWYCFPEIKQNWFGFSQSGNGGTGLGLSFAKALHSNLNVLFSDFGGERITSSSHIEKVCLVKSGVGRDNISDFTTNLISDFLFTYTEIFALEHIDQKYIKKFVVNKTTFNFEQGSWGRKTYSLPYFNNDYVILTPKDILTKDDNWINRNDLIRGFDQLPFAMPDSEIRAQVFEYFKRVLVKHKDRHANQKERDQAAAETILKFPELVDYYIKIKEQTGDQASDISSDKVAFTEMMYVKRIKELQCLLVKTGYYNTGKNTYEEAHARLEYLKDIIENKGGHKIFYSDGRSIGSEKDFQILYKLVWFGTPSDVGSESNDGRGPVDYKISRGRQKTLVEMKLARSTSLERNLEKQLPIYQKASDADTGISAIIFFTEAEENRAKGILDKLGLLGHKDVVLVDARADNKPSRSKA